MGFFKRNKEKDVLDLTERYEKAKSNLMQGEPVEDTSSSETSSQDSASGLGFLGSMASSSSSAQTPSSSSVDYVEVAGEERKKKLAKRFMDMTEKIEDLSNQIYHLQQRIEVLERKGGINR